MIKQGTIKTLAGLSRELKYFEMIYTDLKRDISWKKKHFWDIGFCHYIDSETLKVDEIIDQCHEKIDEVKDSNDDENEDSLSHIDFLLNDLKQLLYRVEVITDIRSEYLSYAH